MRSFEMSFHFGGTSMIMSSAYEGGNDGEKEYDEIIEMMMEEDMMENGKIIRSLVKEK